MSRLIALPQIDDGVRGMFVIPVNSIRSISEYITSTPCVPRSLLRYSTGEGIRTKVLIGCPETTLNSINEQLD